MTGKVAVEDPQLTKSYPGMNFSDPDERNLASLKFLSELFAESRFSTGNFLSLLLLIIYSPIGLVLAILRLIVFLPLVGIFVCIIPPCLRTAYTRAFCLLLFGIHMNVKGKPDKEARVWTANHTSECDALAIRSLANPHILGYSFYLQLWWLKFSPLALLSMVYVPQRSRSDGNDDARDAIRIMIKELLKESSNPILVFPEGGLTNGKVGLLQYHMFMYSLDVPIQPVRITISTPLPINIDYDNSTFFMNVFWILFIPFRSFNLTFLDSERRRGMSVGSSSSSSSSSSNCDTKIIKENENEETVLEFAQRSQYNMALSMGIKASPFLYKDKGHWLKLKQGYLSHGINIGLEVDEISQCVHVWDKNNNNNNNNNKKVIPVENKENSSIEETLKSRLIRDIHMKWSTGDANFKHAVIIPSSTSYKNDENI